MTSSPPTTSDSLFASASVLPAVSAAIVARRPAAPTSALSTTSASEQRGKLDDGRVARTDVDGRRKQLARVGRGGSRRPARRARTPNARPARRAARRCCSRPARRSRCGPGCSRATSSAWRPIEPVEPRMATRSGRVTERRPTTGSSTRRGTRGSASRAGRGTRRARAARLPESLTPASRFMRDSNRSPTMTARPTAKPMLRRRARHRRPTRGKSERQPDPDRHRAQRSRR